MLKFAGLAALLCLPLFTHAQAAPAALSSALAGLDRAAPASDSGQLRVPEARPPLPAFDRGDFSGIPGYSFAYLNDVNTRLIDLAGRSVDVAMFSMTLKDNPEALLRAAARGARVRVIMDESHVYPKPESLVKKLMSAPGVEFRTLRGTKAYGVNHNKILICDNAAAATGSYNWTFGATFSNHENTVVAQDPVYVTGYARYFEWMWSKGRTLQQGPSAELPEGYYGAPPQDPAPAQSFNGKAVPAYLFSPGSRAEERLAELIDAARKSVDAVTFSFSSKTLADAVLRAHKRGVKVRFLIDMNMGKTSGMAKYLFVNGVPMRWGIGRNDKGALHNKFVILDGKLLQTGSFNWTVNASKHSFENLIFITDPEGVKAYQYVYDWFYDHAAAPAAVDFEGGDGAE